jgi:hypothetical protein
VGSWTLMFIATMVQLLFFMFCFSALGEPWRIVLRKFVGLFKNLDVLQILVLDVYLGGFLLYIIAIIPLHLFSATTLYVITLVSIVIIFWLHWKKFRNATQNLRLSLKFPFQNHYSFELILVVAFFLFSLVIQTSSLNGLFFGSVRDTSVHSLFVQILIENKQVPVTLQPYLSEGIIYPQGFTPIIAYSVLVLNYSPPEAVFYLTSLFNALTILGVYFLGKTLSSSGTKYVGLSLAFVFAFIASWPKYITWGSNAFVASFPLYFVCLSFFPFVTREKLNVKAIFAVGFLFGYLAVLHLQVYEALIASLFVLWVYVALKGKKQRWSGLLNLVMISGLSLLVLSPFIYRELVFYHYPYHNIGVTPDAEISIPQPGFSLFLTGIVWFFENLASNALLRIASFVLFFVSVLIMVRFRKKKMFNGTSGLIKLGIAMILGELLVFLFAAINPSDLPFYPNTVLLYFPLYFFVAAVNFSLYYFFSSYSSKKILKKPNEPKAKKLLVSAISFMLLVGIYSPFLYQSIILDVGELHGSYAVFGVTTKQDLQLILWIGENVTRNATILINNFQSGSFIPSLASRKALYPPFGSSYSVSYQKLVTLLEKNGLNVTSMDLMKYFNITNVYVGSGVSSWDGGKHKWNPDLFLGNPNFNVVKNFSDAYLFQFNYIDPNIVFLDDFEHAHWDEYAWQTYSYGHGLSNVTIVTDFGYGSGRCLRVKARVVPTAWEWRYAQCVFRDIYVQNNSDVAFSFYLNATDGFHGEDTFAVLISNIYRNQSIIIATPKSVYASYAHTISLGGFEGFFEFNGSRSLSTLWHQMFNSSLPSTFILEFLNLDFDGIENVAYIDNVKITSTPLG